MRFRQFLEAEGVITAQNPKAQPVSKQANAEANRRLHRDLRHLNPRSVKGIYNGHKEDSFKVPDIEKKELEKLGRRYRQKSVIWKGREIRL